MCKLSSWHNILINQRCLLKKKALRKTMRTKRFHQRKVPSFFVFLKKKYSIVSSNIGYVDTGIPLLEASKKTSLLQPQRIHWGMQQNLDLIKSYLRLTRATSPVAAAPLTRSDLACPFWLPLWPDQIWLARPHLVAQLRCATTVSVHHLSFFSASVSWFFPLAPLLPLLRNRVGNRSLIPAHDGLRGQEQRRRAALPSLLKMQ